MIKIIFPNNDTHSFTYNQDASIKEIIRDFCYHKGLLPDIYEIYDPEKIIAIDDSKSPIFYNLNSLNLRRVTESTDSLENELEIVSNNGKPKLSTQLSDISLMNKFQKTKSIESPVSNKPNKGFFWNKKVKKLSKKPHANSVSFIPGIDSALPNTDVNKKSYLTKFDSLTSDNNKIKRRAPLPPLFSNVTVDSLFDDPDFHIPSPPPTDSQVEKSVSSFMWLVDMSTMTESFSDTEGSIYSSISENQSPSPMFMPKKMETFNNASKEYDVVRKLSPCNSMSVTSSNNSPLLYNLNDEDEWSDPDCHEYAIIHKEHRKIEDKKSIIETNKAEDQQTQRPEVSLITQLEVKKTEFISRETIEDNHHEITVGADHTLSSPQDIEPCGEKPAIVFSKPQVRGIQEPVLTANIPRVDIIEIKPTTEEKLTKNGHANLKPEVPLNKPQKIFSPEVREDVTERTEKFVTNVNTHQDMELCSEKPAIVIGKPSAKVHGNQKLMLTANNSREEINVDKERSEIIVKNPNDDDESDNKPEETNVQAMSRDSFQKDRLRSVPKSQNKSLFFSAQ